MPRIPRGLLLLLAIAIFAGIPSFAEFYTDWLWYREVGYEEVFLKSLSARATTGFIVGGLVFAVLWLNLRLSLRLLRRREFAISTPEGPRVITVDTTPPALAHLHRRARRRGADRPLLRPRPGRRGCMRSTRRRSAEPIRCSAATSRFYMFRLPVLELDARDPARHGDPGDRRRRRIARGVAGNLTLDPCAA